MSDAFETATPAPGNKPRRKSAAPPAADRLPPHSTEAEQGVLGCCLLDPQCIDDARASLRDAEAFFELRHRHVWQAMIEVFDKNKGLDPILLAEHLSSAGLLDAVGGRAYLSELPDKTPSATNLTHYLEIVNDKHLLRRVIAAASAAVASCFDGEGSAADRAAAAERAMLAATETRATVAESTIGGLVQIAQAEVIDKFQRGVKMHLGPTTGFNYLDNMVPGMIPGGYYVLAARPGVGKTAFALQIAEFIARVCKEPVHFFSLEMSGRSLALRVVFQKALASYNKFSNGMLINADLDALARAGSALQPLPFTIDDMARATVEDIEVRARRLRRQRGVRVFFLDYLQLLTSRGKRWNSRNDEMAEISQRLTALAKELQVTFFVLAQMNRQSEQEPHRIPRLSDLRDSGQVEQDADVVSFLYFPALDPEKDKDMRWLDKAPCGAPDNRGPWKAGENWTHHYARINLHVSKHRHGPGGNVDLVFVKDWVRFFDAHRPETTGTLAEGEAPPPEPEAPPPVDRELVITPEYFGKGKP